jgi:hypothetical protein
MTDAFADLNVVFRCPPELEGVLPRPSLALLGLPDWFKAMPASAFSSVMQTEQLTVKKCPPFIDAMTQGFLIPLVTDLKIEDGAFSWVLKCPAARSRAIALAARLPRQCAGRRHAAVQGRHLSSNSTFLTINAPAIHLVTLGQSLRSAVRDMTGLIDTDLYKDNFINFPARWHGPPSGVCSRRAPRSRSIR